MPKSLRHRDLHALDVGSIPEGLEDRIREAREHNVVDRSLSEIVVDPEDVALDERPEQDPIQIARRGEVLAERFLNDDAGTACACRSTELLDDRSKQRGRDGEVVRGMLCASELASKCVECRRVLVVPVDVLKQSGQLVERGPVETAVLLDTVLRPRAHLVQRPARLRHPDHRNIELPALGHRLERGKDLLVREIARGSEKHERVGVCVAHIDPEVTRSLRARPSRDVRRTGSASPTATCSGSPLLRAS